MYVKNVDVLDFGHLLSPSVHFLASFCALLFVLSDLPIPFRMLHLLHFIKMHSLMYVRVATFSYAFQCKTSTCSEQLS